MFGAERCGCGKFVGLVQRVGDASVGCGYGCGDAVCRAKECIAERCGARQKGEVQCLHGCTDDSVGGGV